VVKVTTRPLYPPGKTRYPLYGRLGGYQAGLDGCGKSRLPPGFDPRTVQPVVSRYTDWATRATFAWKESSLNVLSTDRQEISCSLSWINVYITQEPEFSNLTDLVSCLMATYPTEQETAAHIFQFTYSIFKS